MNYYMYDRDVELGTERLGTLGRHIDKEHNTPNYLIRTATKFNYSQYRIYSFTNFYDDSTFKLVSKYNNKRKDCDG